MVERLKMIHVGKKTALGHIAWIQHGASAQLGAICIAPAELSWCVRIWHDRQPAGFVTVIVIIIVAMMVIISPGWLLLTYLWLGRRLYVCHVCRPLDCVLRVRNIYDPINLSDSFKEPPDLAAQHAGHRQAGVEDPLPLQGLVLLPHQKSWGAYSWVSWLSALTLGSPN